MSYQVLARKWRPKSFHTLVGQEHVLKALINALDSGRLHHAYLFTGTRGVGKTTISRILAKCLNCEIGVTSTPCGQCQACQAIDEGRFVDLIEVDAASRTKVEDTRELLENVQYRPTAGRYKVYLIDEVHMLSNHSFNALLKTLEEPPPHVKFLLATTDPQKLPITILSRCLKFHLKNLTPERIEGHLTHILGQEGIAADASALRLLAKSAQGSMRDALSLLDQAIAHGEGRVLDADVREMLGVIDRDHVYRMLEALTAGEGEALMAAVAHCAEFSPDYEGVLNELLSLLHRVAVIQTVAGLEPGLFDDGERVADFAARLSPEDVQLYYQIGLHGRRDLPLAPDAREGLEMALLRMLAFRPNEAGEPAPKRSAIPASSAAAAPASRVAPGGAEPRSEPAAGVSARPVAPTPTEAASSFFGEAGSRPATDSGAAKTVPTAHAAAGALAQARAAIRGIGTSAAASVPAPSVATPPAPVVEETPEPPRPQPRLTLVESRASASPAGDMNKPVATPVSAEAVPAETVLPPWEEAEAPAVESELQAALKAGAWWAIVESLEVGGGQQLALNCLFIQRQAGEVRLLLDEASKGQHTPGREEKLTEQLSAYYGERIRLTLTTGVPDSETPAMRRRRLEAERLAAATESLERDEVIHALRASMGAEIVAETIKPI